MEMRTSAIAETGRTRMPETTVPRGGADENDGARPDRDDRTGAATAGEAAAVTGAASDAAAGGDGPSRVGAQEQQQGPNVMPQRQLDQEMGRGSTIDTMA